MELILIILGVIIGLIGLFFGHMNANSPLQTGCFPAVLLGLALFLVTIGGTLAIF